MFFPAHEGIQARHKDHVWSNIITRQSEKGISVTNRQGHPDNQLSLGLDTGDEENRAEVHSWMFSSSHVFNVSAWYHYKTDHSFISALKHVVKRSKWQSTQEQLFRKRW